MNNITQLEDLTGPGTPETATTTVHLPGTGSPLDVVTAYAGDYAADFDLDAAARDYADALDDLADRYGWTWHGHDRVTILGGGDPEEGREWVRECVGEIDLDEILQAHDKSGERDCAWAYAGEDDGGALHWWDCTEHDQQQTAGAPGEPPTFPCVRWLDLTAPDRDKDARPDVLQGDLVAARGQTRITWNGSAIFRVWTPDRGRTKWKEIDVFTSYVDDRVAAIRAAEAHLDDRTRED